MNSNLEVKSEFEEHLDHLNSKEKVTLNLEDIADSHDCRALKSANSDESKKSEEFQDVQTWEKCSYSNYKVGAIMEDTDTNRQNYQEESEVESSFNEIFSDPSTFEFLLNVGNSKPHRDLRKISLYLKFDPYVGTSRESLTSADFVPLPTLEEFEASYLNNSNKEKTDLGITNDSVEKSDVVEPEDLATKSVNESGFSDVLSQNISSKDTQNSPVPFNFSNLPSPIDRKETMKRELVLLRRLLLQQDHTYSEDLKRYQKLVMTMQRSLQHSNEREMLLKKQMPDNTFDDRQFQVIIKEYEKSITDVVAEKEKNRVDWEEKKQFIEQQIKSVKEHLVNTKKAYVDLEVKFKEMKNFNMIESNNVKQLNMKLIECKYCLKELHENYELVKVKAELELNSANEELSCVEKKHHNEISRLNALIKRSELRISSLEATLEQTTKENRLLMKMCDEFLNNEVKK